jgi:hypothetical protein
MQSYISKKGDTLQSIASRFYCLAPMADDQKKVQADDADRLQRVQLKIQREPRNEGINWDDIPPNRQIYLPAVEGVELRYPSHSYWRHADWVVWLGVALSVLAIMACIVLNVISHGLNAAVPATPNSVVGIARDYVSQALAAGPLPSLSPGKFIVLAGLTIFALWFFRLPQVSELHATVVYLVAWGCGIVIVLILPAFLTQSLLASSSYLSYLDALDLSAIWTALIAIVYIFKGDKSTEYRTYLKPHRPIGISFVLTLLFTFVVLNYTYRYISNRVSGLLAPRQVLAEHLNAAAGALQQVQDQGLQLRDAVKSRTLPATNAASPGMERCAAARPNSAAPPKAGKDVTATLEVQQQTGDAGNTPSLTQLELYPICRSLESASSSTRAAVALYKPQADAEDDLLEKLYASDPAVFSTTLASQASLTVTSQLGTSLNWTRYAAEDSLTTTEAMSMTLLQLDRKLAEARSAAPDRADGQYLEVESIVENELLPRIDLARAAAERAASAVHGVEIELQPFFLGTAALLVLFVLFPWFLLLLFFLRKRTNLASDIVNDLLRLSPDKTLLKQVLGLTDVEEHNNSATRSTGGPDFALLEPSDVNAWRIDTEQMELQTQLLKSVRALPGQIGGQIRAVDAHTGVTAFEIVSQAVADHAFSDLEYVLAATLLSVALGTGWYFVLYPRTSIGLSLLLLQNTGIIGFMYYLARNLTPITAGFLGAYLWSAFMLLRRYYYGDLYPTAYLAALERTIRVFILTLVLAVLASFLTTEPGAGLPGASSQVDSAMNAGIIGLAFFIGIFPQVGLTVLKDIVNRFAQSHFPSLVEQTPLTELDGLNYFVEARLLEENVENVQGMATARIDTLIVDTYFPAERIVDWIDQAVLYMHCGRNGEWFPLLRSAGIRTATDLLDALGYEPQESSPTFPVPLDHETGRRVRHLVEAIRDAQTTNDKSPDTPEGLLHSDTRKFWEEIASLFGLTREIKALEPDMPVELTRPEDRNKNLDAVAHLRASSGELDARTSAVIQSINQVREDLKNRSPAASEIDEIYTRLGDVLRAGQEMRKAIKEQAASLDKLNLDDGVQLGGSAQWRGAVRNIVDLGEALYAKGREAYDLILARCFPPPVTREVLMGIAEALWPDPNMGYMLTWYDGLKLELWESIKERRNERTRESAQFTAKHRKKRQAQHLTGSLGRGRRPHI